MKVFTFNGTGPAELEESQLATPSGSRFGWTEAQPTAGYWRAGDLLLGVGAAAGQTFLCTAEGSPGTWVAAGGGGGGGGGLPIVYSGRLNADGEQQKNGGITITAAPDPSQPGSGTFLIEFDAAPGGLYAPRVMLRDAFEVLPPTFDKFAPLSFEVSAFDEQAPGHYAGYVTLSYLDITTQTKMPALDVGFWLDIIKYG
jgi:hypothetical protein